MKSTLQIEEVSHRSHIGLSQCESDQPPRKIRSFRCLPAQWAEGVQVPNQEKDAQPRVERDVHCRSGMSIQSEEICSPNLTCGVLALTRCRQLRAGGVRLEPDRTVQESGRRPHRPRKPRTIHRHRAHRLAHVLQARRPRRGPPAAHVHAPDHCQVAHDISRLASSKRFALVFFRRLPYLSPLCSALAESMYSEPLVLARAPP